MNEGSIIEALSLTKVYGGKAAVDGIDFQVKPGVVTGFLGPNGAGKSTTMRMILGLDRPTSGTVTVGGRGYQGQVWPLHEVGALLDARAVHPGRSAYDHLLSLAAANGIARARVDEVLELVGLTSVARKRAGGFSLGMFQRLGIAAALLPAPELLILDEPTNGLDPAGIVEMRGLIRSFADDGITVLVSSHLISEIEQICDHVVMIRAGQLVHQGSVAELRAAQRAEFVLAPEHEADVAALAKILEAAGCTVTAQAGDASVTVAAPDRSAADLNRLAAGAGITLRQLTERTQSLERAFFALTGNDDSHLRSAGAELGAIR